MDSLSAFQKELDQAKVDWQSHIYGNTMHAFATPSGNSPDEGLLFNPLSAKRAWLEAERFLHEIFSE